LTADARPQRPPAIVTVDDDPPVLGAVAADLRSRYAARYQVIAAQSGDQALQVVKDLKLRGDRCALLVTDQRMPGMTGTELIAHTKEVYPDIKSVLLTAYADTDVAIAAINDVDLDHYVLKPWDPPEERLFPVLDELLEEWQAKLPPSELGIRLVGDRWSAASHRLRDYLARNLVPFEWINFDDSGVAGPLLAASEDVRLPLLVLPDGSELSDPTLAEVGEAIGLSARTEVDSYDLVVVGSGPAGLAAAVYGASEGLSTLMIEAEAPGGQAGLSARIENYLGFPSGVSGAELTRRAFAQARRFGATMLAPRQAARIRRADPYRAVVLDDGREVYAGAVILATGVQYRRLEAEGMDELAGAGVYYGAASTEAAAMSDARVVVVGGANSAGQAALHLARYADEVVLLVRTGSLDARMSQYLVDQIGTTSNIVVRTKAVVSSVRGTERLETVLIEDPTGPTELEAAGLFVFIGARPVTDWLEGDIARDPAGFVVTGQDLVPDRWSLQRDPYLLETSMPGVFAVGDVRARSVKRIASAVGEGSIAVQFVHQVLHSGRT
jgi:thioredoxin reductase (NADPH)